MGNIVVSKVTLLEQYAGMPEKQYRATRNADLSWTYWDATPTTSDPNPFGTWSSVPTPGSEFPSIQALDTYMSSLNAGGTVDTVGFMTVPTAVCGEPALIQPNQTAISTQTVVYTGLGDALADRGVPDVESAGSYMKLATTLLPSQLEASGSSDLGVVVNQIDPDNPGKLFPVTTLDFDNKSYFLNPYHTFSGSGNSRYLATRTQTGSPCQNKWQFMYSLPTALLEFEFDNTLDTHEVSTPVACEPGIAKYEIETEIDFTLDGNGDVEDFSIQKLVAFHFGPPKPDTVYYGGMVPTDIIIGPTVSKLKVSDIEFSADTFGLLVPFANMGSSSAYQYINFPEAGGQLNLEEWELGADAGGYILIFPKAMFLGGSVEAGLNSYNATIPIQYNEEQWPNLCSGSVESEENIIQTVVLRYAHAPSIDNARIIHDGRFRQIADGRIRGYTIIPVPIDNARITDTGQFRQIADGRIRGYTIIPIDNARIIHDGQFRQIADGRIRGYTVIPIDNARITDTGQFRQIADGRIRGYTIIPVPTNYRIVGPGEYRTIDTNERRSVEI